MIQEIQIDGFPIRYAVNTSNIISVLGNISSVSGIVQLYVRLPTYEQTLRIIYLGLTTNRGYSVTSFIKAYYRGNIHPYKYKNQYTVSLMRYHILARIRQINKEQREKLKRMTSQY